jgi:hypothetical protein
LFDPLVDPAWLPFMLFPLLLDFCFDEPDADWLESPSPRP